MNNAVDGCEILKHQKDGCNPNSGINHRFQLVQDFATIHSMGLIYQVIMAPYVSDWLKNNRGVYYKMKLLI